MIRPAQGPHKNRATLRLVAAAVFLGALALHPAYACDTPPSRSSGLFVAGKRVTTDSAALSQAVATGQAWRVSQQQRGRLLGATPDYSGIFKAMACSQKRRFAFGSIQDLGTNIAIRMSVIELMYDLDSGRLRMGFTAQYFQMPRGFWVCTFDNPVGAIRMTGNPLGCTDTDPVAGVAALIIRHTLRPLSWESVPSIPAASAVLGFLNGDSMLDCLAGLEMIYLSGVELTIGPAAFNALHPPQGRTQVALRGIGVPVIRTYEPGTITARDTAVRSHLVPLRYLTLDADHPHAVPPDADADPRTGAIAVDDMVPGDYAYIQSLPDYDTRHPGGAWNGENCVYLGQGRFYGLGLGEGQSGFQTTVELQRMLAANYGDARPEEMRWTLLSGPTLTGADSEAGPFLR